VTFIGLNPSKADATREDPTLRACIQFAQRWGYGSLAMVNLFGYCTAHPTDLKQVADPVGPENDRYLLQAVIQADRVVLAWGNGGGLYGKTREGVTRDRIILTLLAAHSDKLSYLRLNRNGQPCHPLYIPRDQALQGFKGL
jgi:hypothetical protein